MVAICDGDADQPPNTLATATSTPKPKRSRRGLLNSRNVKVVAAVLVVFASLAVVFGAYRWTRGDDERDRAEAATNEFAAYFGRAAEVKCDSSKLEPLPDDSWRFTLLAATGAAVAWPSIS